MWRRSPASDAYLLWRLRCIPVEALFITPVAKGAKITVGARRDSCTIETLRSKERQTEYPSLRNE